MSRLDLQTTIKSINPAAEGGPIGLFGNRAGAAFTQDFVWQMAMAGRVVVASDADQNDTLTGQTSFANTTPTLLLNVPTGSAAIPLFVQLAQTGTVGGGAVDVLIEADDIAAYASGGTAETLFYFRNGLSFTTSCAVYSSATATAGYGINLAQWTVGQDVSPAEGADNRLLWQNPGGVILYGPASLKVFTYAATTGPTWFWQVGFIDVPLGMLN